MGEALGGDTWHLEAIGTTCTPSALVPGWRLPMIAFRMVVPGLGLGHVFVSGWPKFFGGVGLTSYSLD